jgi:hypothetical protein
MVYTLQGDLDPLDLEIVERALQGVWESDLDSKGAAQRCDKPTPQN